MIDVTLTHALSDTTSVLFDGVFGYESGARIATNAPSTGDALWYGVSGYVIQKLNDQVSVAGRLEWYRDQDGYTTGLSQTLYEATVGLTITPFPNDKLGSGFKVRPEVRFDYSDEHYFDNASKHDQWTFAVDAFYNF